MSRAICDSHPQSIKYDKPGLQERVNGWAHSCARWQASKHAPLQLTCRGRRWVVHTDDGFDVCSSAGMAVEASNDEPSRSGCSRLHAALSRPCSPLHHGTQIRQFRWPVVLAANMAAAADTDTNACQAAPCIKNRTFPKRLDSVRAEWGCGPPGSEVSATGTADA